MSSSFSYSVSATTGGRAKQLFQEKGNTFYDFGSSSTEGSEGKNYSLVASYLSPCRNYLVTADDNEETIIRDARSPDLKILKKLNYWSALASCFSNEAAEQEEGGVTTRFALVDGSNEIRVFDLFVVANNNNNNSNNSSAVFDMNQIYSRQSVHHDRFIYSLQYHPKNNFELLDASYDGGAAIYDISTNENRMAAVGMDCCQALWNPNDDGATFVVAGSPYQTGAVQIFDSKTCAPLTKIVLQNSGAEIQYMRFVPRNKKNNNIVLQGNDVDDANNSSTTTNNQQKQKQQQYLLVAGEELLELVSLNIQDRKKPTIAKFEHIQNWETFSYFDFSSDGEVVAVCQSKECRNLQLFKRNGFEDDDEQEKKEFIEARKENEDSGKMQVHFFMCKNNNNNNNNNSKAQEQLQQIKSFQRWCKSIVVDSSRCCCFLPDVDDDTVFSSHSSSSSAAAAVATSSENENTTQNKDFLIRHHRFLVGTNISEAQNLLLYHLPPGLKFEARLIIWKIKLLSKREQNEGEDSSSSVVRMSYLFDNHWPVFQNVCLFMPI